MLQNAYFLAKIGADTAENEQNFAEFFPKFRQKFANNWHRAALLASQRRPAGPSAAWNALEEDIAQVLHGTQARPCCGRTEPRAAPSYLCKNVGRCRNCWQMFDKVDSKVAELSNLFDFGKMGNVVQRSAEVHQV